MPAQRAIALLSGGLDSIVAAAMWLERGGVIARCLFCDYGQRAAVREGAAAERFARTRRVPWQSLGLPWLEQLAQRCGSALVATERALPVGTITSPGDADSARAVWVPARNAVFVAAAAAFAEVEDAAVVLAGFNREEAATFPDNSAAFVAAGNAFLALGTRTGVRVESPTLELDKPGIVATARRLGIGPGDVWSCYRSGPQPCGTCESCLRSARAWSTQ